MATVTPTARSTVQRRPDRASYDRDVIDAILDEALVCHVAICVDGAPVVVPMNYARDGDRLVLHGARAGRLLGTLAAGAPVSVAVTLLDGLVLARSAFRHSLNYRSVVVFGTAREVAGRAEKRAALAAIVEHLVPGRSREVRPPSDSELDATLVVEVPLAEVSAKVRQGPPLDLEADLAARCWAGEIPLAVEAGAPRPDAGVDAAAAPPLLRRRRRLG